MILLLITSALDKVIEADGFWRFDIGQVITFSLVLAGWVYTLGKFTQRLDNFDEWRKKTDDSNAGRDVLIRKMDEATIKLTAIMELMTPTLIARLKP